MSNTTPSLYNRVITQSKELALKAKAKILESSDKQKFISAAINKKIELNDLGTEHDSLRSVVKEGKMLSVNDLANKRIKINRAEEALEAIESEYLHLFGKTLVMPG